MLFHPKDSSLVAHRASCHREQADTTVELLENAISLISNLDSPVVMPKDVVCAIFLSPNERLPNVRINWCPFILQILAMDQWVEMCRSLQGPMARSCQPRCPSKQDTTRIDGVMVIWVIFIYNASKLDNHCI